MVAGSHEPSAMMLLVCSCGWKKEAGSLCCSVGALRCAISGRLAVVPADSSAGPAHLLGASRRTGSGLVEIWGARSFLDTRVRRSNDPGGVALAMVRSL